MSSGPQEVCLLPGRDSPSLIVSSSRCSQSNITTLCAYIRLRLAKCPIRTPRNYIIASVDSYSIGSALIIDRIHPPTSSVRSIHISNSPTPHKKDSSATSNPPLNHKQLSPTTSPCSTQLNLTQLNSIKKTQRNHNVHPPHLPLAALPPSTLHRHRHLLVRGSTPRLGPF